MMNELSVVQRIVVWVLPVVFAITVHEAAHGWMARKKGDNTAYLLGRVSLNPIRHIDPLGTVILPGILLLTGAGIIFGWAKPVPVDGSQFKRPLQDMAWVAAAGPLANVLMAVLWALVAKLAVLADTAAVSVPLIYMGLAGISINLGLFLINLLPIPPLDGSRILTGFLPPGLAWRYNLLEPYGFVILVVLLYTGMLNALLAIPMRLTQQFLYAIAGL